MNPTEYWNGVAAPYEIERSLRFNDGDTAYLSRTPSSATNRRTSTFSCWVKRGNIGTFQTLFAGRVSAGNFFKFQIRDDNRFEINTAEGSDSTVLISTPVYRDVSAWYHIVIAFDTTQATSTNRVKFYVNGTQVTSFDTSTYPPQNTNTHINNTGEHLIGNQNTTTRYLDGYMAEVNFVDGTQLAPSDFGETDTETGAWIPKKYTGSYGTNGFYLSFSDNSSVSALGTDSSGNGNNFTPSTNFSVTAGAGNDSLEDTPTNNWCTLNPLNTDNVSTFSNGNLDTVCNNASTSGGSIAVNSGKWYAEVVCTAKTAVNAMVGICTIDGFDGERQLDESLNGGSGHGYVMNATKLPGGASYGATWAVNDVIGIALDLDSAQNTVTFYKNGTSQGAININNAAYVFACSNGQASSTVTYNYNFGQRAFDYTPPTGFKALNTANLPEPTIKNGTDHFNTVLYTGNGGTNPITTVGFQPDLVWIKKRNSNANHGLHDSVRVIGGLEAVLYSNTTDGESTGGAYLSSFDTSGFTVNNNTSGNALSDTFVAWNWLAGGSTESLDTGTIVSTVSRNVDAGFSIVTYTGNGTNPNTNTVTVGHGLGAEPAFIITKKRSSGTTDYGWSCWHKDLGAGYGIWLHLSNGRNLAMWQGDINHSSTVFSPATLDYNNESGQTYVNYVFAEVEGYSKFGSYTGNGSPDGVFVACPFRPAFLVIKKFSAGDSWFMYDNKRNDYNPTNLTFKANESALEGTNNMSDGIDFLSNGFKPRNNDGAVNDLNADYIYMAFAETPFKYANAR